MSALKSRLRLLYLLEALKRETDEEHPLSMQELCDLLSEQGIGAERKAIYRDIAALNEIGYEVISTRVPKAGFFLMKRDFELPEVRLLVDAVQSAPFLTAKKTALLTEKLCALVSRAQSHQLEPQLSVERRRKFENEEIYYTIDSLHRAITENKKIRFLYYHKQLLKGNVVCDAGREFIVSPYALLWTDDKYYLAANYDKYDSISNYRLDRMKRVCMLEEASRPCSEVSEYTTHFDAADYVSRSFRMYRGEMEEIELSCAAERLEDMLDRFGNEAVRSKSNGERFSICTKAYVSDGLVKWLLQYGGQVTVLRPDSLRVRIEQEIQSLCRAYDIGVTKI